MFYLKKEEDQYTLGMKEEIKRGSMLTAHNYLHLRQIKIMIFFLVGISELI